ncbi:hypothetical protein PDIDSM_3297 [Penicillium digitatum]|nr:hypothetical protein PDIDSM_3297 [Penicillium digitatum]
MSSRGTLGMIVSVVFTALATCFVAMRMYTRVKLMNRVEANDWMVIIALVNSYVFMALDIIEAVSGMGVHLKNIPPSILERQMKAFWLTIPFYNAAVLCAKASILMQYFRVFPTHRMRVVCWVMITFLGIYGTWAVISAFLNCVPVAKFWDESIPGFCLSKTNLWFSNAIIPSQLSTCPKDALMIMFALGGFQPKKDLRFRSYLRQRRRRLLVRHRMQHRHNLRLSTNPKTLIARFFPGMVSTFNASRTTRGDTTRRNSDWNGDATTFATPAKNTNTAPVTRSAF